jgi:hypothetical protein
MQISMVNRPSTALKGPVKVRRMNSAAPLRTSHSNCCSRDYTASYPGDMTVREMLRLLQQVPREAEVLAFEPGCEEYCEREVDEVEWQGGRVYLQLGVRRDEPPQR